MGGMQQKFIVQCSIQGRFGEFEPETHDDSPPCTLYGNYAYSRQTDAKLTTAS